MNKMKITGDVPNPLPFCGDVIALCNLLTGRDPVMIGVWGSVPVCWLDPGAQRQLFQLSYNGRFYASFDTTDLGIPCVATGDYDTRYRLEI